MGLPAARRAEGDRAVKNFYSSIQRHWSGDGFAVVLGYAPANHFAPGQTDNEPVYDTFSEAFDVADKAREEGFCAYTQNDTGQTFADLMREELATRV